MFCCYLHMRRKLFAFASANYIYLVPKVVNILIDHDFEFENDVRK